MVLSKQLRFGHKSALRAYVSSEQLQNVLKCVCVCVLSILLFSGLEHLFGWFLQQSPLSPWSVSKNGGLQCQSGNHYSEIHCSFIRQLHNPIQAQETELSLAQMPFDITSRKHKAYHRRKGGNFKKSLLKNQSFA